MKDCNYDDIYTLQNKVLYNQQDKIKKVSVCVVGLGGIGSVLCRILSHFGVRKFTIIDNDCIDPTNLTRLIGANVNDITKKKTIIAEQNIQSICNNLASIQTINENLCEDTYEKIFKELKVDFVFGCVDNLLARQYINKFAIEYKIPYIDCGIALQIENNKITMFRGQCIFIEPGEPCLMCRGGVNDNLNYGEHSAPLIQVNTILASIAAMEFCKYFTKISPTNTYIEYDALLQQTIEPHKFSKLLDNCDLCKTNN